MAKIICLLICVVLCAATGKSNGQQQQQMPQQQIPQPQVQANTTMVHQTRLDDIQYRLGQDKKEIIQYLNTKNIIKTMLKLLLGSNEESMATSRQVLNVFVKMLELLKSSFGHRARSSSPSRIRDGIDSAAQAGISMLQGYVKSVLTTDQYCIQRNICEGAMNAARESRELGGIIAQLGGYATGYLLENQRSMPFTASFEAARLGRSGADCNKLYRSCSE